jgi:hypothetical protein
VIVERAFGEIHPSEHVVHRERSGASCREDLTCDFQYGCFTLRDLRLFSCDHYIYGDKSSEYN